MENKIQVWNHQPVKTNYGISLNGPFIDDLPNLKMVIFRSYVK